MTDTKENGRHMIKWLADHGKADTRRKWLTHDKMAGLKHRMTDKYIKWLTQHEMSDTT
jgi:hypothetical protein